MPTRLTSVVIDSTDPLRLARWWADALGWEMGYEYPSESGVVPPKGDPGLELTFGLSSDEKVLQNRVHFDLRSTTPTEQRDLIRRLIAAGATEADIGQGSGLPWTVRADPEGNEFCVLSSRS